MKYQVALLVFFVIAMATSLFSLNQITYYFTKKEIILGRLQAQEFDFSNESLTSATSAHSVLGVSDINYVNAELKSKTYKGYLFDQYFAQEKSPLYGYGEDFVQACSRYGTPSDCTLLPAIAHVETNLCKTDISASQYNCWGYGGSGPNRIIYHSFPEAIDDVTKRLKQGYGDKFFQDPEWGGLTYCGGHCVNWGKNVQLERVRINRFFTQNGHAALF